jgi:hypothetical protein
MLVFIEFLGKREKEREKGRKTNPHEHYTSFHHNLNSLVELKLNFRSDLVWASVRGLLSPIRVLEYCAFDPANAKHGLTF